MRQVTETLLCDPCQAEQRTRKGVTVVFGYAGGSYETELCTGHARTLEGLLTGLAEHARRVRRNGGRVNGGTVSRAGRRQVAERSAEIRAWAAANGLACSQRGRIPATVVAAYEGR